MNDLISRSEINDIVDELEIYADGRPNTDKVEVSVLQLRRWINKLKNIPTAYDINKVIAELEELADNSNDHMYESYFGGKEDGIREAIEIVKQSGVSDDVYEWKRDDMLYTVYEICGDCFTTVYQKDFKYCLYCGKKIKVIK